MDILRCVVLCPPWYLRVAIFLSLSCCGVCYLMSCCGVCYLQPAPPTQSLFQFASHTLDPTPSICYRHPKIFPALFLCLARIAVAKEHSNGDGRRATAATVASLWWRWWWWLLLQNCCHGSCCRWSTWVVVLLDLDHYKYQSTSIC